MMILLCWYYFQLRYFCTKLSGASKLTVSEVYPQTPLFTAYMYLWREVAGHWVPTSENFHFSFPSLTVRRNQPSGHITIQLHGYFILGRWQLFPTMRSSALSILSLSEGASPHQVFMPIAPSPAPLLGSPEGCWEKETWPSYRKKYSFIVLYFSLG